MRNKGRNILLGVIIIAIVTTTVISLGIYQTTNSIITEYKSRFSTEVIITPKVRQLTAGGASHEDITSEQYLDFAESVYLDYSIFNNSINTRSETIKGIDESESEDRPSLRVLGNSFREFDESQRAIRDGRLPAHDNECIISSELAELNDISIGDSFTLFTQFTSENVELREGTFELTVVGIYIDMTEAYGIGQGSRNSHLNRRNEILTTYNTIMSLPQNNELSINIHAAYFLKNPSDIAAFESELRTKGLDESFAVRTDEDGYKRLITPVEGLNNISLIFLIIILAFGTAILILLSTISIRERKYEIGVLRAMGMKKRKVTALLWGELLIITGICLCFGITAGIFITPYVSAVLVASQIADTAAPLSGVDIKPSTITGIVAITFIIVSFAGFISIRKITKYEPIKILMDRD